MAIAIKPYTPDWIPAVRAFNQRLADGGVAAEFRFPESDVPTWLPRLDGRRIYQDLYLAVDGNDVRGAYILKFQDFSLRGEIHPLAFYRLPISEGIVNKAYSSVGVHMLRSAMRAEPSLFCLGMGGFDRPLPQMLKAMGWSLHEVPFYFKVNHAARFFRQIVPLRRTASRRLVADLAAFTGTGWAGINILQRIHTAAADRDVSTEPVSGFGDWADQLWRETHSRYPMIASRDRTSLDVLYPAGSNFIALKVSRGARVVGWAIVLDTQMRNSKYFGDLRVGSIVDCLAAPEDARDVVDAAARCLEERGVDLIACNQAHAAWTAALKAAGFLAGPSNFIFAASRPLQDRIALVDWAGGQPYLMRGDGDGPVHL